MNLYPYKKIHLIAFDNPNPPDYGGAIDVFYKIKALKEAGVEVILHYFNYGRCNENQLKGLCAEIFSYPRKKSFLSFLSFYPFIVITRKNTNLLKNLQQDNFPILFEGLHTTFYLNNQSISKRFKVVRNHNIEPDYYRNLASDEKNIFRKIYYYTEFLKLRSFEGILKNADLLLNISSTDNEYFKAINPHSLWVPVYHPFQAIQCKTGKGEFVLYHGNLAVTENIEAINFLTNNIFPVNDISLVIAGRNPDKALKIKLAALSYVRLIENPDDATMLKLNQDAQMHVIPTFQSTGMKLKLLNALLSGRHVLVNPEMILGTGLDQYCIVCRDAKEFSRRIQEYMHISFTQEDIDFRNEIILNRYSNIESVSKWIQQVDFR